MNLYELSSRLYLTRETNCYKRIVVINEIPEGPLKELVKPLQHNKLSIFDVYSQDCKCQNKHCFYGILDPTNKQQLLCIDDITKLFQFLLSNQYEINTQISKLIMKNKRINSNDDMIAYITYS